MAGISHNVKAYRPCRICGKPDYCNYVEYPSGDLREYCHRTPGNPGDTIQGRLGGIYRLVRMTEDGFAIWEPLEQYERNREAFIKEKGLKDTRKGKAYRKAAPVTAEPEEPDMIEGCADILPPEKLNLFYRTFLDLLVLEDKHEAKLRDEWDKQPGLYDSIVKNWPVRSVPPEDRVRFSSKEKLKNLSRKKIVASLIEKCGEPYGVPGFYRKKDGTWTFYRLSGIAYPIYDTHGNIVRIRIGDDYPEVAGELNGVKGSYFYMAEETGTGWYFVRYKNERPDWDSKVLAWQYGGTGNLIALDKKGYPAGGKVNGKYKNFSSFQAKTVADETGKTKKVNAYKDGCQSGSFCSVYSKVGDDSSVVYVTEGEKKAMVANIFLNVPVISVPGVKTFKKLFKPEEGYDSSIMSRLRGKGMQLAVLLYDSDKKENADVLRSESDAVQEFMKNGLRIAIGEWNPAWGKGLDDILLTGVMPQITPVK